MSYKQLREECFFKTGREGVVLEFIDQLEVNEFNDNRNIDNSIFHKSSKIRATLVDARKSQGKGKAIYYNLDPNEVLLLNYLLSDGVITLFKERVGAYNALSGVDQLYIRSLVGTFDRIDTGRFDMSLDFSTGATGTAILLQKNIGVGGDNLLIRKLMVSYEEAMRSASKWKITIEEGEAKKDTSKGNGLNIVKYGTYKEVNKTHLMLQTNELILPISEAAKRVSISQYSFYIKMKEAQADFTRRKIENNDYEGERISIWNPQGKPKFEDNPKPKKVETKLEVKKETEIKKETDTKDTKDTKKELKCDACGVNISESVYNYSVKFHEIPLCMSCQKKKKDSK